MNTINIKPIVYLVIATFIIGLCFFRKNSFNKKVLFYVLLNYFITEIISIFLNYYKIPIDFLYNISIFIQFVLWLIILSNVLEKKTSFFIYLFIVLSTVLLSNKFLLFNNYNFLLGSILYLGIYIYGSFNLLNDEKIDFFQSNDYLLISIPILFFLGMSFLFSFNLHKLTSTLIFGKTNLYTVINYFVNIIYYSLINIYIYKEQKLKFKNA